MNLRILVCPEDIDVPQQQLRPKPVPPDPTPIFNARPEQFNQDNQGVSAVQASEPPDFDMPILDE